MTNQEIYNSLSELEHKMWEKFFRDGNYENLTEQQAHSIYSLIRQVLIEMDMYYKKGE